LTTEYTEQRVTGCRRSERDDMSAPSATAVGQKQGAAAATPSDKPESALRGVRRECIVPNEKGRREHSGESAMRSKALVSPTSGRVANRT